MKKALRPLRLQKRISLSIPDTEHGCTLEHAIQVQQRITFRPNDIKNELNFELRKLIKNKTK
jgi:hypothetical protein